MIIIKKYKIFGIYSIILILFTTYVVLDTFVISSSYKKIALTTTDTNQQNEKGEVTSDDKTYEDDNIKIEITEYRENNTSVYVADVILKSSSYLKTAFASNTYGKNVTAKTSTIAEEVNAILAINGDYYGVQERGYVLKGGTIYRNTSNSNEDLVIYNNGSWGIINENNISLQELVREGAKEILSFGPALIDNSKITVGTNDEVDKAMRSNPRTAIGLIDDNHYVFVVSDGRTDSSTGLTLYELAEFMNDLGCKLAYNLDGGGSSTMYFNGKIVNNPTSSGRSINERKVSDIVYIGY